MLSDSRIKFEAAYTQHLLSQRVGEDVIELFFDTDSNGNYRLTQVASAWWGWCNNPELSRLRKACDQEFASVEQLSNQVEQLKAKLALYEDVASVDDLAGKLTRLRAASGLSQRELGNKAGVVWSMISKYESGQKITCEQCQSIWKATMELKLRKTDFQCSDNEW